MLKRFITAMVAFGVVLFTIGVNAADGSKRVKITTNLGVIEIELAPTEAPASVENFLNYAKAGFYDGTIFHRVIPGFMIQGGDPNTKGDNKAIYGTGGHAAKYYGVGDESEAKSWNLPAEFSKISHKRGILSMARSTSPNSGGSQFFICAADAPHLDGQDTVFGQVVEGDNVIEQIVNLPRDSRDNPNDPSRLSLFTQTFRLCMYFLR